MRWLSPAIAAGTSPDVDRAVAAAQRARDGAWGRLAPAEKGRAIAKIGKAILDHAEELALIRSPAHQGISGSYSRTPGS